MDCGLLYKLFTEFGIKGRMWVAIKDLYTDVKARVLYSGSLSRSFDVSQGTGQGRILAPFMYKVYINSLLHVLTDHCYSICINPPGTKGFGTHTKHQGGGVSKRTPPPVSQEREMLQT